MLWRHALGEVSDWSVLADECQLGSPDPIRAPKKPLEEFGDPSQLIYSL
jgi:hypothetical protein